MSQSTGPTASVVNSTAYRDIIAKVGLDEKEAVELFLSTLNDETERLFAESLLSYTKSLLSYNNRSYLLGSYACNTAAADIYIPATGRWRRAGIDTDIEIGAGTVILADGDRLLLEGGAGSGKSTVLREMARCAWTHPERIGLDREHIALPIKMRSLAEAEGIAREGRLWSAIEKAKELDLDGSPPPTGFLQQWSRSTGAPWLFLIDGYDEVPAERGAEMLSWVLGLAVDDSKLVLSSRPNAVPDTLSSYFHTLELLPLDDAKQRQLAMAWFGSECGKFLDEFSGAGSAELRGTPLIITIAASVFRSNGRLPYLRSELYEHFVKIACDEGLKRAAGDELSPDLRSAAPKLIPKYLSMLARSMSEGQERGATLDFGSDPKKLTDNMSEQLRSDLNLPTLVANQRAEELYNFLGRRSGIIRASSNHFEWIHPTFREYFTALAYADDWDIDAINTMFGRATDPSWRQIILFLFAIRSEHGCVDQIVEELAATAVPYGVALAGVAISEGADVSLRLSSTIIEKICDLIRGLSGGFFCERALSSDYSKIGPLRDALRVLRNHPSNPMAFRRLGRDLEALAIGFGKRGSNAVEDLRELSADDSLRQLATGASNPLPVRLDSVAALSKLGYEGEADDLRIALTRWSLDECRSAWPELVEDLVTAGPVLLARVASCDNVRSQEWARILDSVEGEKRDELLCSLADNPLLPDAARMAVRLRLLHSNSEALSLLGKVGRDPALLKACLAVLERNGAGAELLKIVQDDVSIPAARVASLRSLKRLCDADSLLTVVNDCAVGYILRRRAAEAAFQLSLTSEQATVLNSFFDGLANSDRPPILRRRAQLLYQTDRFEEALPLFRSLLEGRSRLPIIQLMYAHSLEQLGLSEEAFKEYEEAEHSKPGLVYANCRMADILFEKGRVAEAANVAGKVWTSDAPDWFFPIAFLILKRADRPDDAARWLRDGDWPEQRVSYYRAELSVDRGFTNTAIKELFEMTEQQADSRADFRIGQIRRMRCELEEALVQFAKLAEQEYVGAASEQADILIRLRRFAEADKCLSHLTKILPDDPYDDYLVGLSLAYQGDPAALLQAAERGLAKTQIDNGCFHSLQVSNRILFCLARGDLGGASGALELLIDDMAYDHLRTYTIPYLETLSGALDDDRGLRSLQQRAVEVVWPRGWNADDAGGLRRAALATIQRQSYPFPMYCQRYGIDGLEEDGRLAERILAAYGREPRSIVLWTIGSPERIYGHSNFVKDEGAEWDLKFCDEARTLVRTNLRVLCADLGVRRLIFLEEDLLGQFEFAANRNRLPIECIMADIPVGGARQ